VLGPVLFLIFINDIVDIFGFGLKASLLNYLQTMSTFIPLSMMSMILVLQEGVDAL